MDREALWDGGNYCDKDFTCVGYEEDCEPGMQISVSQPDMPENAIAIDSGCIDFALSPEGLAREIVRITQGED